MPWRKTLRPLLPLRWPSRCIIITITTTTIIIITITCTTWLPRPRRRRLLPNKQNCGAASAFRTYAKLQTLRINLCPESFFSPDESSQTAVADQRVLCLWMESVWLLLGSRPRRWSGRSVLGFLGRWPFRCEDPCRCVLDCLGFPWILSSPPRRNLRG